MADLETPLQRLSRLDEQRNSAIPADLITDDNRIRPEALETLITALTDYRVATTNPADQPLMEVIRLRIVQNFPAEFATYRATSAEAPDLIVAINHLNDQLNAEHGTTWSAPAILISKNIDNAMFIQMGDAILVDADIVENARKDPQQLAALLAHEMGHRWQRSVAECRAMTLNSISLILESLGMEDGKFDIDQEALETGRLLEIHAELEAARFASPMGMYRLLENLASQSGATQQIYRESTVGKHPSEAQTNDANTTYEALNAAEKITFYRQHANKITKLEDAIPNLDHPPIRNRLELMATISAHPELLAAEKMVVDDRGNIQSAEGFTPTQLARINREGDRAVSHRNREDFPAR